MRIVIDMQVVQAENRNDGLGRYNFLLMQEIARNRGEHEVFIVLNGLFTESIETIRTSFQDLLPRENIRVWEPHPLGNSLVGGYDWRCRTQELVREAFISGLSPDVVLVGSMFEGETDNAIVSAGVLNLEISTAVVVSDLTPFLHRCKCLGNSVTEAWYERKLDHLRRAEMLLTLSESAKRECIQLLGFDAESVIDIGAAADPRFSPRSVGGEREKLIYRRYEIFRPFVLCFGFKCAESLMQAYAALPMQIRQSHQLLVVAHTPAGERARLMRAADDIGLAPGEYVITPDVLDADLPDLLRLSKVFIAPAWEAGLGLTTLEAMACGKAAIGADISCHREILGREDALFEPWDVEAMSAKLAQALSDDVFRKGLEHHATEHVAKLSFRSAAKKALFALEARHAKRLEKASLQKSFALPRRPKMAYVAPLLPERTGIADYSAELLPELARHYDIDVIVEQSAVTDPWVQANCRIHDAAWLATHAENYDRVLYHIGNSMFHKHMFDLIGKVPGVVVLHDFYLAQVFANMDFSGEFPGMLANELYRSHGYLPTQKRYKASNPWEVTWRYPCNLRILQDSIGIIVHSASSVRMARKWYDDAGSGGVDSVSKNWSVIPHLRVPVFDADRTKARQILDIGEKEFVVCSFGVMGASKLNHRLIEAWLSSKLAGDANAVLVFVGEAHEGDYGQEIAKAITDSGIAGRIRITGWVDKATFRHYLEAADVAVQLRTLSRGETSGTVLDCMNYGVPTVINANGSLADISEDCAWKMSDEFDDGSLVEALENLWKQPNLRRKFGKKAREVVLTQHAPRVCAQGYFNAIESAYRTAGAGPIGLAHALAKVEPYPKYDREFAALARSVVASIPGQPVIRQLLVDISAIVNEDLKTGVQRVTRSILREFLTNPPAGFRVEPVYDRYEGCYRYARNYSSGVLGIPGIGLDDTPAEFNPGDIFFILDLNHSVVLANRSFYSRLRNRGIRIQFLVHDILPITMPQYFPKGMAKEHHHWLEVVTENDGAICVSKTVADDLKEWLTCHGAQRQRPFGIGWSHNAADIDASCPSKGLPAEASAVLKTLMAQPTFLMVGTVEPRKGYAQTISAFEKLWSRGQEINLVVVGKQGWNVDDVADRLENHAQLGQRLFWLKGISDEYLMQVYAASDCLISASEGEGFGLPLIEGAQHGLPIIARDIPVFREVAGDHATYFHGNKADAMADVVLKWLGLFRARSVPDTRDMPFLTWAESARTLMGLLLDDTHPQWVHRWMPAESTSCAHQVVEVPGHALRFDADDAVWIGWSEPEKDFRWNLGRRSSICFCLAPEVAWQGRLILRIGTLGPQRIGVRFNGVDLGEETLAMYDKDWVVDLALAPLRAFRENELVFEFHDAKQPGPGDRRLLAMWIRDLKVC